MLKAQLQSKVSQLGSGWQDIEDILTGDFFGALDYLPRQPFLRSFIEWIAAFNADTAQPTCEPVDWEAVEFIFWPMITGEDESAEPDLVIVSNRWVIVVEVKLDSGLGMNQPWREFCVGREIAQERGISADAVFYLVVARHRLDVAETATHLSENQRQALLAHTSQLRWSQAAALVERWLRDGVDGTKLSPNYARMLDDLHAAMRCRRSIVFSGFEFINQSEVLGVNGTIFCPERFRGFLSGIGLQVVPALSDFLCASAVSWNTRTRPIRLRAGTYRISLMGS